MRWWRRHSRDQDLDRELRMHLELEAEEQQNEGLTPDEARYAACRTFGNITYTKEEVRRMWGWTAWEGFVQDIRYAFRTLRKSPGFALTGILTLALAIGASTAIFTVVDSVLLRPLAYRDSGKLIAAWEHIRFLGDGPVGPNPRHVDIWQKGATAFHGLTMMRNTAMGLTIEDDHPRLVGTVLCLANMFDVLQAQPFLGRGFLPENSVEGHDKVAILSHGLWQSLFHGDAGAIGKIVRIDGIPREVIGVLPADFHFPNANALRAFSSGQPSSSAPHPDVFLPAVFDFNKMPWGGNFGNWITLGRLKPGISIEGAEAQLNSMMAQILEQMPGQLREPGNMRASVQPMQEAVVGASSKGLWLLMAAVMGLMLIACLNLANAQLARTLARRRDAAVRAALGAAKARLLLSAIAENFVLAAVGGAGGVLLAVAGLELFRRYSPLDLPRLSEVSINPTVLVFSLGVCLTAILLSGLLPALRFVSTDPHDALQQNSGRSIGSRSGHRLRSLLVGLQVFGCTALLILTGLFAKTLLHLFQQDKGFETKHTVIAEVVLAPKLYSTDQSRIAFIDSVLANMRAIPGVQAAGLVSAMPLEGERWIESAKRMDRPEQEATLVNARWASPGYFEATGQMPIAGRLFEERDRNLDSVIISQSAAKALWDNGNPIGSQLGILGKNHTVIGVVADSRITSLKTPPAKIAYVHYKYRTPYTPFFVVRGVPSAEEFTSGVRQAIWKYAPAVTVARVKTLDAQLADSLAMERFQTAVLMSFGVAALFLAMLGIYGVLSYSVAIRKNEIGVRMALGATRNRIYALVFSEAAVPVAGGLAAGLIASLLSGRVIRNMLYGTQPVDAVVILLVLGLFLLSAVAAAFLPVRRAVAVDPMEALRME